jgi:serine protease Do
VLASLLLGSGVFVGLVLSQGLPAALNAQVAEPLSSADRQKLYAQLDEEVAALEKHGSILKKVYKLSSPFVVHIEAKKSPGRTGERSRLVEEAGSGTLIEHRGKPFVLTNRHVIKDAENERITIHLDDGREFHPTRVVTDPDTDIAVMFISASDLTFARLGDSNTVEIGDFVLAVGSPFGLSRSLTYGIISAKGRRDLELGGDEVRYQDFLQTDAAINPGNSGGPLLNLRGEVIGMNTAIASASGGNEGIGFSIPINMAMIIARQLIDHGEVSRAFLGVNLDSKFGPAMAAQLGLPRLQGARVTGVTPNSPAAVADLRANDVVLEFDGIPVEDDVHLVNIVSLTPVDRKVPVVIFRDRKTMRIEVKVGDRRQFSPRSSAEPPEAPRFGQSSDTRLPENVVELGLTATDIDADLARRLKISRSVRGVLVTEVEPRGPCAGQIERGEVIDQIDRQPIRNLSDLRRVLDTTESDSVRLHILPAMPGRSPRTVVIQPDFDLP